MNTENTEFVIKVSAAKMPASCWGKYQHVAVLEVEKGTYPKMISTHAKGVKRIVKVWRNQFKGTSLRCAAERAYQSAINLCRELEGDTV